MRQESVPICRSGLAGELVNLAAAAKSRYLDSGLQELPTRFTWNNFSETEFLVSEGRDRVDATPPRGAPEIGDRGFA